MSTKGTAGGGRTFEPEFKKKKRGAGGQTMKQMRYSTNIVWIVFSLHQAIELHMSVSVRI